MWRQLEEVVCMVRLGAELYMASWIRGMLFNKQADQLSRWINKDDRALYVARWCREFRTRLAMEGRGGNAQVAVVAINFAKNTPQCE